MFLTCFLAAALANPPAGPAPAPAPAAAEATAPVKGVPHGNIGTKARPEEYTHRGRVLETATGGGYTYVKIEIDGVETWAAGPQTQVEVGDWIVMTAGNKMVQFWSRTMNRTFDEILFVGSIETGEVEAGKAPAGPVVDVAVEPLEGGQTIAQILARTAELSGKPVRLRAQVVKVNEQIMGKNWLHVRDSSGEAELTVTSSQRAAPGAVVVLSGTLTTDRDFGSGYVYAVIVEEARIEAP